MSIDLAALSVRDLLSLWAGSLRELHRRKVVRTFNNPIGDIAEELVARQFDGQRGGFNQKTWDVETPEGFLQVKAARMIGGKMPRNVSPVRSDDGYLAVVVVLFTDDLRVDHALWIPREVVNDLFARTAHVNGRIIRFTARLLAHPSVTRLDISDEALDD